MASRQHILSLLYRIGMRAKTVWQEGGPAALCTAGKRYWGKAWRQRLFIHGATRATAEAFPRNSAAPLPLCVILDHDAGGGTLKFREQLVRQRLAEGWRVLVWQYFGVARRFAFMYTSPCHSIRFQCATLDEALRFVRAGMPEQVFINELVGWPDIPRLLKFFVALQGQGTRVEVFLHDFFALCPVYNLMLKTGAHCGLPMPPDACPACLDAHPLAAPFTDADINGWRGMWEAFLRAADALAVADESARDLIRTAYPSLRERLQVRPLEPLQQWPPLPRVPFSLPCTVAVIGTITGIKGAGLVKQLAQLVDEKQLPIRILVIGTLEGPANASCLEVTGAYVHARLPDLLRRHAVQACLVPTLCPETFCYVAQEIETLDLPLITLDMGAQGRRARRYTKGFVADSPDAHGCLKSILTCMDSLRGIETASTDA